MSVSLISCVLSIYKFLISLNSSGKLLLMTLLHKRLLVLCYIFVKPTFFFVQTVKYISGGHFMRTIIFYRLMMFQYSLDFHLGFFIFEPKTLS